MDFQVLFNNSLIPSSTDIIPKRLPGSLSSYREKDNLFLLAHFNASKVSSFCVYTSFYLSVLP